MGEMVKKIYTNEMAIEYIRYRLDNNLSIRYTDVKRDNPHLLFYIEKNGGMTYFAEQLGFNREELVADYGFHSNILPRLTKEEIGEKLSHLKSRGLLTTNSMRLEYPNMGFESQVKKMFGSTAEALKHFNLTRDRVVVTKESLFKELQTHINSGVDLNYANMLELDSKLVNNATNKFAMGWNEFLSQNGIEFDTGYKRDSIEYGLKFEKMFKQILDAFNIENIYNKMVSSDSRPDFQLKNNHWLDCKLSSWTNSIPATIHKYLKYCDKVTIVYYRGRHRHLDHMKELYGDRLEVKSIEEYYPKLIEINRHDLINELKKLI